MRGRVGLMAAAVIIFVSAGVMVYEAWNDSLTYDETRYMRAGYCALTRGVIDIEPTNPAGFKLLSGFGLVVARPTASVDCATSTRTAFFDVDPATLRWLILAGRLPLVAVALVMEVAVFLWARALYGAGGGLVALAVAGLEPNLVAHGHLATGDMLVTAGTVVCLAALWRHRRNGGRGWLALSGAALGFALLAKLSAVLLVPALVLIVLLDRGVPRGGGRRGLAQVAVVAAVAWLTVCAVYLPFHTEHTDLHLAAPLAWVAPPSWLYGVWYQLHHVAGGAYGYLNGEVRVGRGFVTYYLEAIALKSTVGFLLLGVLAAGLAWRRRDLVAALYLWVPALLLLAAASVNSIDIGVRYILPLYPLLAVAAGGLAVAGLPRAVRWPALAGAGLLAAASLLHAPYHIGYFNELAGSHPEAYLADSNLDWGQDAWRLRDYWVGLGRPRLASAYFGGLPLSAYGIDNQPAQLQRPPVAPGQVALSLTQLLVYGQGADLAWAHLLDCRQARLGTSIVAGEVASDGSVGCPGPAPQLR